MKGADGDTNEDMNEGASEIVNERRNEGYMVLVYG